MAFRVYHEKQVAALCGRHALNNLLQGPYVDEFSLAEIARELDDRERALMLAEGADTAAAVAFLAEDSGNVDDAGNFSLTVLREYLERAHRVSLVAEAGAVARAAGGGGAALEGEAFFLNLDAHWLAVRRLPTADGPRWFDLNSLLPLPRVLGDVYLGAFLAQMRAQGYFVFVVQGALPAALAGAGAGAAAAGVGTLHTVDAILADATSPLGYPNCGSAVIQRFDAALLDGYGNLIWRNPVRCGPTDVPGVSFGLVDRDDLFLWMDAVDEIPVVPEIIWSICGYGSPGGFGHFLGREDRFSLRLPLGMCTTPPFP